MRRDLFLSSNPLVDNDSPYFGVPLSVALNEASAKISILTSEDSSAGLCYGEIPVVVAKCGVFLKNNGLEIEGIFRVGGRLKRLKELQQIFNTGPDYGRHMLWDGYTVHDAASILRRYLNALPEPLIPLDFYEKFREPIENRPRIVRYMTYRSDRLAEDRTTPVINPKDKTAALKSESPNPFQESHPSKENQSSNLALAPVSVDPAAAHTSYRKPAPPPANNNRENSSSGLISPIVSENVAHKTCPSSKSQAVPIPMPDKPDPHAILASQLVSKSVTSDDNEDAALSPSGSPPLIAHTDAAEHGQPLTEANITRLNVTGPTTYGNCDEAAEAHGKGPQPSSAHQSEGHPQNISHPPSPAPHAKKHRSYKKLARDVREALEDYKILVDELPTNSKQLLFYILDLLAMVQTNADENLMSARNLAAIFQPSILSHPNHDLNPEEYALSQVVVEFLIQYAYKLLPHQPQEPIVPSPQPLPIPDAPLNKYQDLQTVNTPLPNILDQPGINHEFEITDAELEVSDLRDVPPASKFDTNPELPLLGGHPDTPEPHPQSRSRSSTTGKVQIHVSGPAAAPVPGSDIHIPLSAPLS